MVADEEVDSEQEHEEPIRELLFEVWHTSVAENAKRTRGEEREKATSVAMRMERMTRSDTNAVCISNLAATEARSVTSIAWRLRSMRGGKLLFRDAFVADVEPQKTTPADNPGGHGADALLAAGKAMSA
eukprot:330665-Rhodomonas_salina.1